MGIDSFRYGSAGNGRGTGLAGEKSSSCFPDSCQLHATIDAGEVSRQVAIRKGAGLEKFQEREGGDRSKRRPGLVLRGHYQDVSSDITLFEGIRSGRLAHSIFCT